MNIYHVTAFPYNNLGGNKAGVVYPADTVSNQEKQTIAELLNYSETAFVSKSLKASFKVQFFTPISEVDLCGHATIATFNTLRDEGVIVPGIYTQETKAGILEIDVRDNKVFMEQKLPTFGEVLDSSDIRDAFDNNNYVNPNLDIQVLSTGMLEIFVPIKDVKTLNNLNPQFDKIVQLSKTYHVIGIHAFAFEKNNVYGRNFAPYVGIDEESATGTSNGALSCYLQKYVSPNKVEYELFQGFSMNKPSVIESKLLLDEFNEIRCVWVGGTAQILRKE